MSLPPTAEDAASIFRFTNTPSKELAGFLMTILQAFVARNKVKNENECCRAILALFTQPREGALLLAGFTEMYHEMIQEKKRSVQETVPVLYFVFESTSEGCLLLKTTAVNYFMRDFVLNEMPDSVKAIHTENPAGWLGGLRLPTGNGFFALQFGE